jgi:hypothetical protein
MDLGKMEQLTIQSSIDYSCVESTLAWDANDYHYVWKMII